ncbi:hypothetical protein SKAU_G00008080 [Synaphobranchus kaupii]|uniref:Uncharacterized protein n=1 Tax=Synaphobranchus kaupii TaxID=118154 RepID=A0A9Q1G9H5_SYNKA|nr:hypothetical protein SKAU_G00008080 [Synaphobranchus kaupii]
MQQTQLFPVPNDLTILTSYPPINPKWTTKRDSFSQRFHRTWKQRRNHTWKQRPPSPVVPCSYLPDEFIYCQAPVDHAGNMTAFQELGHGCVKFGGQAYKDVNHTRVLCTALDDIECSGPREFPRGNEPCIKYTGHYFITTLLYSFFLGCFGGRPLLPRAHGHGGGEAAHPRRTGHLVVCGPDPAHHWRSDAQRRQQLVHFLLRAKEGETEGRTEGEGAGQRPCGSGYLGFSSV